ncbi:MAG: hypothetical protein H0T49_04760 [Chloroflexia bacterium]|nr:hypothetical protein [Chloroflexia bacterium]
MGHVLTLAIGVKHYRVRDLSDGGVNRLRPIVASDPLPAQGQKHRFGDTVQRLSRIDYQNMHRNRAPVTAVAQ